MNKTFEKRFGFLPANFIVFGAMLLAGAVLAIVFYSHYIHILLALIFVLPAIFIFSVQTGIVVDFEQKKVLRYWGPFGKKYGKWMDVSDIKYVAIVSIRLRDHFSTKECTYTTVDYKGRINLITKESNYITLYQDKKEKALIDAHKIARGFNVKVYDNSEGKKRWIEP